MQCHLKISQECNGQPRGLSQCTSDRKCLHLIVMQIDMHKIDTADNVDGGIAVDDCRLPIHELGACDVQAGDGHHVDDRHCCARIARDCLPLPALPAAATAALSRLNPRLSPLMPSGPGRLRLSGTNCERMSGHQMEIACALSLCRLALKFPRLLIFSWIAMAPRL